MMGSYRYEEGLESKRLRTRFLTIGDVKLWSGFYLRDGNSKYLLNLGGDTPEDNARLAVERQLKRYADNTYGLQGIIEKETGHLIGQCGLLQQSVHGKTELEIGYQLFNDYWGQGYATEAAMLFRDYGFSQLGANSIISIIAMDNVLSQRVAERNGMQRQEQISYMGFEVYIYRIQRKGWELL